jgi:hypothetical protein
MDMSLTLTPSELAALTGRQRPSAQARWLSVRGWPHERDADGRPVVLRAVAEARLAGVSSRDRAPRVRLPA